MGIDLLDEFARAFARTDESHFDWMRGHGVADRTMYRGPAVFGVERPHLEGNGLYQPHPDGTSVLLSPVGWMGDFEIHLIDLVAWRPADPATWWLRLGNGDVLNPEEVERADHFTELLQLFDTPLAWLQNDCCGSVILRWDRGLRITLGGIDKFVCSKTAEAKHLDSLFRRDRQSIPEIRVLQETVDAA